MSLPELSVIFVFGLISSLHCVQMCGPLVIAWSLPLGSQRGRAQMMAHLSYHSGRIITYTLLGGAAGLAGQTLRSIGDLAGVENVVSVTSGGLMLVAGLLMLDLVPKRFQYRLDPLRSASQRLQWIWSPLGRLIGSTETGSKFLLGLMLGFLPCGLIYTGLLKAMSTGEVLSGALTMASFGAGTVTSLLGLGVFSSALSRRMNKYLSLKNSGIWGNRVTAVSVALLGAFMLYRGLSPMMRAGNPGDPGCHTE